MVTKTENRNLRGFRWIWVYLNGNNLDKHQLFLKEHAIKKQEPEHPKGRTLFLLNIPPYATINSLKNAFTNLCGKVNTLTFNTSIGFKTGYLVFNKESSLDKVLRLSTETVIALCTKEEVCLTGIAKWCKEYNESIKDKDTLKKEIEDYMQNYDKKIIEQITQDKAAAEEDEDGWVTVTSRKKRGQFAPPRKESTLLKIKHKEKEKARKKQLLNFYTFQIRESKKQHLAELRKKFELDKKRLQELKSKRTFKPF